jgi:hypothetical protein
MFDKDISCKRCGDATNYPPPDMPTEYRGYCPPCTAALCEAGELPPPTREAILNYLATAVVNKLMGTLGDDVEVHVAMLTPRSPSEIIVTPAGPTQYSQN